MTDFDDDLDFAALEHPADRRQPPYKCTQCDHPAFDNYKALTLHITGSHTHETCRVCGKFVGTRGLSSHEAACRADRTGRFDDMLPNAACRARLRDFVERADEPVERDDVYCVACQDDDGDPSFVRDIAIGARIEGRGPCMVFPANMITADLFVAAPKRDRRTGAAGPGEVKPADRFEPRLDIGGIA